MAVDAHASTPIDSNNAIGPVPFVTVTDDGGIDTPGLPGFKTYTLTFTSSGAPMKVFQFTDLDSQVRTLGFFGAMNQVIPLGQKTVFQDSNHLFPLVGALPSQDSQFLFSITDLRLEFSAFRIESDDQLEAIFEVFQEATSMPFVQLVIPNQSPTGGVRYAGWVVLVDGSEIFVSGEIVPVPEPGAITLVVLAGCGAVGAGRGSFARRRG